MSFCVHLSELATTCSNRIYFAILYSRFKVKELFKYSGCKTVKRF